MNKKVIKILSITLSIVVILGIICTVGFISSVKKSPEYVAYNNDKLHKVYSSLTVVDEDGEPLQDAMYYNNVKQIPLSALNKYTYMAFVCVEDKRFFDHKGVDYKRVAGAMLNNIKSKSYKEGASTISQQLIKNTHLDNSKTIQRKVNEIMLARQLEKHYSKEEILEMYLNTIYFGRNAYGIENAANVYFNKSASNLTLDESAILAGLIKAPATYAPDKNIEKCKARRDLVLKLMLEQKVIDNTQYNKAINSQISYCPQKSICERTYMYFAIKEACNVLNMTQGQLLNSDIVIHTYCNSARQKALQELAHDDLTMDKNGNLASLKCVLANNNGHVTAYYSRGEEALQKRQVGSTIKPIAVYTPALNEKIITQASLVLDEPTNFGGYVPTNVGGYNGWTTIKYAIAKSLNIPAVKTLNALTVEKSQKYLAKMGFIGKQDLSLALGNINGGMTPLDLTRCYTTLANDGKMSNVRFIDRITKDGVVIYQSKDTSTKIFDKNATYIMTDMLKNSVKNGTAKNISSNVPLAVKTGTVGCKEGNSDALVAGYTTKDTFVVWYSGELSNDVNGATAPCHFTNKLLKVTYKENIPSDFVPPKGVQQIALDKDSLYNEQLMRISENGEKFWFDNQNKPTEKLESKQYDYQLSAQYFDDKVEILLPKANGEWHLYKEENGNHALIYKGKDSYIDEYTPCAKYFAELIQNGKTVYTTPKIEVIKPNAPPEKQDMIWDILDYWYWK